MTTKSERAYLSGVEIRNFRALGTVDIQIHAGPGLILLVGPNGLGKTSWFEAIEMALTGRVRRWFEPPIKGVPSDAQARNGVSPPEWSIGLQFRSHGTCLPRIERTGPPPITGTPIDDVIHEILAPNHEAWILSHTNLSAFLHSTHFLPQSVRLRFLSRDPRERWEDVLSQVSGFGRILRASRNLGQGTQLALTNIEKDCQREIASAKENLAKWESDLKLLENTESRRAGRPEAISPSAARERLQSLSPTITLLPKRVSDGEKDAAALAEVCRRANEQLSVDLTDTQSQVRQLLTLRVLPAEWLELQSLLKGVERRVKAEESAASAAEEKVRATQAEQEAQSRQLKELESELSRVRVILQTVAVLRKVRTELRSATEAEVIAQKAAVAEGNLVPEAEQRLADALGSRERRANWDAEGESLQRTRNVVSDAEAQLAELGTLTLDLQTLQHQAEELAKRRSALELDRNAAAEESTAAHDSVVAADSAAREARNLSSTIQNAVAVIAAHLESEDTVCPVCRQEWAAGKLLSRALNAAAATDPELLRLEEEAKGARSRLEQLKERVSKIDEAIANCGAEHDSVQLRISQTQDRLGRIGDHALFRGQEPAQYRDLVNQAKETLSADEDKWKNDAAGKLPPVDDQSNLIQQIETQLEASRLRRERAIRLQGESEEDRSRLKNRESAILESLQKLDPGSEATEDDRTRYEHERLQLEQEIQRRLTQKNALEERIRDGTASLQEASNRLANARSEAAKLGGRSASVMEQWRSAGLAEPISAKNVEDSISELQDRQRVLARTRDAVTTIADGVAAWLEDQGIAIIETRLSSTAGGSTSEALAAHTRGLTSEVGKHTSRLQQINRAREFTTGLRNRLEDNTDELRDELVSALKPPISRLLRALVLDRRFHNLSLSVSGSAQRGEIGAAFGSELKRQADHYLSEGQMAGVSVAVLLAMATTFNWSRWPAVLLDDPAQNNDLIHTANLMDVLRNLALGEGFQVFISTHDRELGEFVQRKFRNSGVNGTVLRFREASDERGVVPIVSSWNGDTVGQ